VREAPGGVEAELDSGGSCGKARGERVEREGGVGGAALAEWGGAGPVRDGGGRRREGFGVGGGALQRDRDLRK